MYISITLVVEYQYLVYKIRVASGQKWLNSEFKVHFTMKKSFLDFLENDFFMNIGPIKGQ